jgi:hypothetical protein
MRATPRQRHFVAIILFAALSAGAGALAWTETHLSTSQIHLATAAAKRAQPHRLYVNDPIFGPSRLWRLTSPAVHGLMELVLVPTDYRDLTLPYRTVAGAMVFLFLCGMYALIYRQTRSWSIAAVVAVMSSVVTETLGRAQWGIGPLASITPYGVVITATPWIVLSYLHYRRQWRVVLVFLAVGLLGNIHLDVALNLALILTLVYLAEHRFAPSAWPMGLACLGSAALGALPYAGYYLAMVQHLTTGPSADPAAVARAFEMGQLAVLYPNVLDSLLDWLIVIALPLVASVAVLLRFERFRVRDAGVWLSFLLAGAAVSLGLHGISQLVGILTRTAPPVIDFIQASALLMLPLYVLFAQALTHLFRLVGRHRIWLQLALAGLVVGWVLPSDNLQPVRHWAYDALTAHMEPGEKPRRVQAIELSNQRHAERVAIAEWARRNSDRAAVFCIDDIEFRMRSRRSIITARQDVRYIFYLAPQKLDEWMAIQGQQQTLLHPKAPLQDLEEFRAWFSRLAEPSGSVFRDVSEWYVVLPANIAPQHTGAASRIAPEGWGEQYRLYRIPVE